MTLELGYFVTLAANCQLQTGLIATDVKLRNVYSSMAPLILLLPNSQKMPMKLFSRIKRNPLHVLCRFLPEPNCHQHSLRPRRHNFSLSIETDDRNFI